jgi:predicted nucleotidyltransferase component of viral defense system
MLNFEDALKRYPERLRGFKENILKEYLQYRILDIIYGSTYGNHLVFIDGTSIRIAHRGMRFSEDLDFDNRGLKEPDFERLAKIIQTELEFDGYTVETKNVFKGAYHCYIKLPGLLFEHGMTGHKQEKILIQIDAEPQKYNFTPDRFLINEFGIFRYIAVAPLGLLLSQKIYACLNRKREQGRDFFDVVFLMSLAEPDYRYLNEKTAINNKKALVKALKDRIKGFNMKTLARDIEPFLFDPSQKNRVAEFGEWLKRL